MGELVRLLNQVDARPQKKALHRRYVTVEKDVDEAPATMPYSTLYKVQAIIGSTFALDNRCDGTAVSERLIGARRAIANEVYSEVHDFIRYIQPLLYDMRVEANTLEMIDLIGKLKERIAQLNDEITP